MSYWKYVMYNSEAVKIAGNGFSCPLILLCAENKIR